MKLNRENYEFLMFELLEGNLMTSEGKDMLHQINKDPFYAKEWALMQQTIVYPDTGIRLRVKNKMLKTSEKRIVFIFPSHFRKIAATLLLFGSLGLCYYYNTSRDSELARIQHQHQPANISSDSIKPSIAEPFNPKVSDRGMSNISQRVVDKNQSTIPQQYVKIDSLQEKYEPEILYLSGVEPNKIDYNTPVNEAIPITGLYRDETVPTNLSQMKILLGKAERVRKTTRIILKDLPNLTLRISPKLKDKKPSIGFLLKGDIIYAHAIIEIKK